MKIFERWRVQRRVRALPEASGDLAAGAEARVTGVVRVIGEVIMSPLTSRPCVLSRVRVRRGYRSFLYRVRPGVRTSPLVGVHEAFAIRPFLVERSDGSAIEIDGDYVEIDVPPTPRKAQRPELREGVRNLLGLTVAGAWRYEEMIVEPGATVTVTGYVMVENVATPPRDEVGFRDGAPRRFKLIGSRKQPLTISV